MNAISGLRRAESGTQDRPFVVVSHYARRAARALLIVAFLGGALTLNTASTAAGASGCASNPIVCENALPGSPPSEWQITGDGETSIQGFATQQSVNAGETVYFKVKTDAADYKLDIYRLGYYGGDGARFIATVHPSAQLPQIQPSCLTDSSVGLIDCGNWAVSASWQVPSDAVSGVYLAHLVRSDTTGRGNHIIFVVRNDGGHSDLLFQTSDATWTAYNNYGGTSLYPQDSVGGVRGYKVSYNRPVTIRDYEIQSNFFYAESPMVRWLERNGYDVSYFSGVDTATRGGEILNHKAFLSVGHDEYWSAEARANLERARDAGVSLAFFSGNTSFWKTRWENSIDGSNTPTRTMVTYKESNSATRLDPTGIWTGTWRDARFSPPADGGRPENALIGTIYKVNAYRNDAIEVPAADGRLRFWRNTGIDQLAPGTKATLAAGTLGYEWDVDDDNGFRPAGLIDMSSTTVDVNKYLLDYGATYGPATAKHSLTLYRATSGALVFSAGTVQWSWGLDSTHDSAQFAPPPTDPRMQQATVNLLADMGAQALTLQSDLTGATKSTDTTGPSTQITNPADGSTIPRGAVTISGTATDTGGGVVGGVEVSTDGGTTWHPANGRESWTYTWSATTSGTVTIKARAIDDSGNIGLPASATTQVGGCPCSIWTDASVPANPSFTDPKAYELGMRFQSDTGGYITAIRFYKGAGNTGTHVGHLWTNTGTLLSTAQFRNETATGWQQATLPTPVAIAANTTYVVSYYAPNGNYALDRPFFGSPLSVPPLKALADGADGANGVFKSGTSAFPTQSMQSSNYWVDVVYNGSATDTQPPSVLSTKPADGATGISVNSTLLANVDEPLAPSSVSASSVDLRGPSGSVPATIAFDTSKNQITLTPTSALAPATTYTATVHGGIGGVTDVAGNSLAADYSWSFTTFSPASCPCSIWGPTTTPATTAFSSDTNPYELGVKFRSDVDGFITAVRFYKGSGNTGTHLGHLWSSTGAMLGEVKFVNETATGWQQAVFPSPISIKANTTYIASYYDPAGRYALDRPFFTTGVDSGVLHALADGFDGGNGVLKPGTSGFPSKSTQSSNYWVDVVYDTNGTDRQPPSVVSNKPAAGATGIGLSAPIWAGFDEALAPASVSSSTVELRGPAGPVAATVAFDGATNQINVTPSAALAQGTQYTVVVHGGTGGVTDVAGNALAANYSWSFTTFTLGSCPCSIWSTATTPGTAGYSADTNAYELGVKFRSDMAGYVTGIRFYKGLGNTGTHLGHLWTSTGTKLAEAKFVNETATGWQQVQFASPVAIAANTTYIASYYDPQGNYALDRPFFTTGVDNGLLHALADGVDGGNGVLNPGSSGFPSKSTQSSNYWVDVVFDTSGTDRQPPSVLSTSPAAGATGLGLGQVAQAQFDEALAPSSVNSSTVELRGPAGAVNAAVAFDASTNKLSVTPVGLLMPGNSYTVVIHGGSNGVTDTSGNPMVADYSWSFSTYACPCSIWPSTKTPATPAFSDTVSYELGVKFRSDIDGYISGIRFYKGAQNTGLHLGHLWTASGTMLGEVTFTNETATGWQQALFATAIPIKANTTYVASYYDPAGYYALDRPYFTKTIDSRHLHALADGTDGGNGVFKSGTSGFPFKSNQSSNYWVDVVYTTAP